METSTSGQTSTETPPTRVPPMETPPHMQAPAEQPRKPDDLDPEVVKKVIRAMSEESWTDVFARVYGEVTPPPTPEKPPRLDQSEMPGSTSWAM